MSDTPTQVWPIPRTAAEIQAVAADWVVERQISPVWTDEKQAELDAWLLQSVAHRIAFVRFEDAWKRSRRLAALRRPALKWSDRGLASLISKAVAVLGVISILAVGAAYFVTPRYETFATSVGERRTLTLPDGSKIELTTDTTLHIAADDKRRVWLDRGEAFFQVQHSNTHPFIVTIADHRVIDLGTEFAIQRNADDAKVTLLKGLVRIEPINPDVKSQSVLLHPGESALTTPKTVSVSNISSKKMEEELSWRRGVLMFDGTPLEDVVAKFNRYNKRQLAIGDPVVAMLKIDGTYPTGDVDSFLRVAKHIFQLRLETHAGKTVILR